MESEQDPEAKSHLALFHQVLEAELRDELKARDDFILNGVITYSTVWMIFEPGTTVTSVKDGENCAAKLPDGSYESSQCGDYYALNCQMIDWDGENFGIGKASSVHFLSHQSSCSIPLSELRNSFFFIIYH